MLNLKLLKFKLWLRSLTLNNSYIVLFKLTHKLKNDHGFCFFFRSTFTTFVTLEANKAWEIYSLALWTPHCLSLSSHYLIKIMLRILNTVSKNAENFKRYI